MEKTFVYKCPRCGREIIYKTEYGFNRAVKSNILCRNCRDLVKGTLENYSRKCPICGNIITYKRKSDWQKANKINSKCLHCSDNAGKFKSGIKMDTSTSVPKYSLDNLLNKTLESYYWLGFIIADGSFCKNRFEFSLKKDDLTQIIRLCEFLNINKDNITFRKATNSYRISFNNKDSITKIMNTFDIHYAKTYNPCNFTLFNKFSNSELVSFLIGIIDGDGCISKDGKYISITAHKNWKLFYSSLINKLGLNFHINERKNNILSISAGNKLVREYFLNFLSTQKLPILERKWNRLKI